MNFIKARQGVWAVLVLGLISVVGCSSSEEEVVMKPTMKRTIAQDNGVAMGGYDPVAYFKEGQPRQGLDQWSYSWKEAQWFFSNEENLKVFQSDPEKYAPQYGGHCAFATSLGKSEKGKAELWSIVEGKLYLNYNGLAHFLWKILPGRISSGNENWAKRPE